MHDLILRNGTVIDGTGADRFRGDVAVDGHKISAVGNLTAASAATDIDITGKVVAPGFIDVHNHSDGWLLRKPNFVPKTTQGFTCEVLMADGIGYAPVSPQSARQWVYYLRALDGLRLQDYEDWETFEEFMTMFEGRSSQNVASHLPYANIREMACGWGRSGVDDFQMREIQRQIRLGMEAGAVGVSTGLDYIVQCYASTDELVEALTAMAPYDGLYVPHMRYKKGLLPAIVETIEIGRRAGVRVHISHLKAPSGTEAEQVFELLDRARADVDISYDVYPYQPGSTMLNFLLPYEVWEDGPLAAAEKLLCPEIRGRFERGLEAYSLPLDKIHIAWMAGKENSEFQGLLLTEYVAQSGRGTADALADLLIEERLTPLLVFNQGDDKLVEPFLQDDRYILGTDGIYCEDGPIHPRVFGSTGRILGPLVRDRKLFSLERAVHVMSGAPADRFRLPNRGRIAEGCFADLTVFDPETVTDVATYDDPHRTTVGITDVFVNGTRIVADGEPVTAADLPGRFVRAGSPEQTLNAN